MKPSIFIWMVCCLCIFTTDGIKELCFDQTQLFLETFANIPGIMIEIIIIVLLLSFKIGQGVRFLVYLATNRKPSKHGVK